MMPMIVKAMRTSINENPDWVGLSILITALSLGGLSVMGF